MNQPAEAIQLELKSELATRFLRHVPLEVSEFPWDYEDTSGADLAPIPGAINFYYSRDARALDGLSNALVSKNVRVLTDIRAALTAVHTRKAGFVHSVEEVRSHDCVFDIRYGTKTIFENRVLPADAPLGTVSVSWTGGTIDEAAFTAVEHTAEETERQTLHYLVIRRAPYLSTLERRVLDRLPAGISEMNIGLILAADTMQDVGREIGREAERAARTRTCGPELWRELEQEIESGMLTPAATVSQLVRLRQELINRSLQQQQIE